MLIGKKNIGNEKGRLGEEIACRFLVNKGFKLIERNYQKKWGEIDIIASKYNILHFIEVKSVSRENINCFDDNVSELASSRLGRRVTDNYRPEDNIHLTKLKRLARTVQVYLLEKYPKSEPEWVFDAITVRIDTKNRQAHMKFLADIAL